MVQGPSLKHAEIAKIVAPAHFVRNFFGPGLTNPAVHVARLLPASILRAFRIMGARFLAVFADTPVFFFAVVIGVALTFRVAVGAVRDASTPPVVAPTFVTGAEPGLAEARSEEARAATAAADGRTARDAREQAEASAAAAKVELGAAARVQPIGRSSPRSSPRGHVRRPPR